MKHLAILLFLLAGGSAWADDMPCSVHPGKNARAAILQRLATVSLEQARTTALKAVGAGATVIDGELEAEHGCLVYSFDLRVSGKGGVDEVMVDAGNGAVLTHAHETPEQEAAEQRQARTRG